MTHDEAERIVDHNVSAELTWAGYLAPPSFLAAEPAARDHARTEVVLERAQRALIRARLRFRHLRRRIRYQPRRDGVWVPAAQDLELDDDDGSETIRVDVEAPMTQLTEGLMSHHFVSHGKTVTREVTMPDDGAILMEWASHTVSGFVDLRADPLSGPHGLIRLFARVRNTTEPLTALETEEDALAHSLVGCHMIVVIDKGKFIDPRTPPRFAEPYLASCESEGVRPAILGEPAKILLSSYLRGRSEVNPAGGG